MKRNTRKAKVAMILAIGMMAISSLACGGGDNGTGDTSSVLPKCAQNAGLVNAAFANLNGESSTGPALCQE